MAVTGRVIEEQKNYFIVDTPQGAVKAKLKGTLKLARKKICTGDTVDLEIINLDSLEGIISLVHKRTSLLPRPAIANLTQVAFILSLKEPSLDFEALNRLLFSAEVYQISSMLVFNKVDLLDSEDMLELEKIIEAYQEIGYKIIKTSALTNSGLDELVNLCTNQISAFTGPSGVGKSTLLSRMFPEKVFRIGAVSGPLGRGTHTTTNVSLLRLKEDSYVADTPGISFINIPTVPEEDVVTYFPELERRIGQCRFNNCIHDGEPGCVIQELADKNEIMSMRREYYLKIYREMIAVRKQYK